ncbi:hypothetical protein [Ewingella americana]|uniref:hypothetical protein n=1 Tax=Ewingella americana TaxID=41202 RepID=UPI00163A4575|nr:hypothetical protein [Ewingella americana]QMV52065.1 hypothetical protein GXP68_12425 [Ewingella americana]
MNAPSTLRMRRKAAIVGWLTILTKIALHRAGKDTIGNPVPNFSVSSESRFYMANALSLRINKKTYLF